MGAHSARGRASKSFSNCHNGPTLLVPADCKRRCTLTLYFIITPVFGCPDSDNGHAHHHQTISQKNSLQRAGLYISSVHCCAVLLCLVPCLLELFLTVLSESEEDYLLTPSQFGSVGNQSRRSTLLLFSLHASAATHENLRKKVIFLNFRKTLITMSV